MKHYPSVNCYPVSDYTNQQILHTKQNDSVLLIFDCEGCAWRNLDEQYPFPGLRFGFCWVPLSARDPSEGVRSGSPTKKFASLSIRVLQWLNCYDCTYATRVCDKKICPMCGVNHEECQGPENAFIVMDLIQQLRKSAVT
ncbi:hypothetical protein CEXT_808221 [Caerostris extrusa]|uniref:Uncharacterized protein n=1 Tax=Caerostris extrusa TaxID=172846 RepID=A0AAV4S1M3_CAEEX|nr:hypothetical protein CEXT_808221 [Caerostris extrusa]